MKMKILFCLLVFASAQGLAQKGPVYKDVSVKEFKLKMDNTPDAVILDLRTDDELKEHGTMPKARQIDYFARNFEDVINTLDKEKAYLIFCASGIRSSETSALMKKLGFREVYNLEPGFNAWKKAKMPVVPSITP